jgi:hypothetical protein
MVKPVKREGKKTYTKPTLTVYGTVRELTQKLGHNGRVDGGTMIGKKHSHL